MDGVAERLIAVREKAGLGVADLAFLFRIQASQIYQVESGARKPGATFLNRYVKHELLTEAEAFRLLSKRAA